MKQKPQGIHPWAHWYWVNIDRVPGFTSDVIAFVVPTGTDPAAEIDVWMRDLQVDPALYRPYVIVDNLHGATDTWKRLRRERKAAAGGEG